MISIQVLTLSMGFVLVMGLFSGCTSQSKYGDQGKAELLKENPLEPCPDSPNCVRESREVGVASDGAIKAAKKAIGVMDGKITSGEEDEIIESEFKAFVFTDDFEMAVTPLESDSTHSVIHIRSYSRVGKSDLGVNPKRVTTFWEILSEHLD